MSDPKILIQLDPDTHCSVFDAVVAIDSGVDHLLQYAAMEPLEVRDLVYGAMFTRGAEKLKNTAIFIGGRDVQQGEALLTQVTKSFFGPMRVSVMMDANGANTTAAAAVTAAGRHLDLANSTAIVLAATGPVGQRAVRMLARSGANVRVASRRLDRAEAICTTVGKVVDAASRLVAVETANDRMTEEAIDGADVVITAGASGVQLLTKEVWQSASTLKVVIDLNAVPPLGVEGIDVNDKAADYHGKVAYGAIGVGGTKMQIHKECVQRLFTASDHVLDADEIFDFARQLEESNAAK